MQLGNVEASLAGTTVRNEGNFGVPENFTEREYVSKNDDSDNSTSIAADKIMVCGDVNDYNLKMEILGPREILISVDASYQSVPFSMIWRKGTDFSPEMSLPVGEEVLFPHHIHSLQSSTMYYLYIKPEIADAEACSWVGPIKMKMPSMANLNRSLLLSPQRAKDEVRILQHDVQQIQVYNAVGEMMLEMPLDDNMLHVGDWPKGSYYIVANNNQGELYRNTFVKE
ncbi:MAG: hypothetical protein Q4F57_08415 [Weeksellaceae bacterium]|nr:hypothetical protein [Weeksellaceae bacterium]